ncbi:MAG: DUF5615 family PIN-like protein [Acidobacteria bacterium]|nr:DUF5615 family PIN-like protein [Acidobacteriota bacterium]
MKIRFQADNDLNETIVRALLRTVPQIDFQTAPALGLHGVPDEKVLGLAADEGRVLVSCDRRTMPFHFADFIAQRNSPGIFILSTRLSISEAANWLYLFWETTEAEEHINTITYIP